MLSAASALPAMAAPIMAAAPAELGAARSPYANFLIGRYAIANGDVTTAAEAMNAAAAADPSSPDLRESAFLIGILNGDIDRPVVDGAVYNGIGQAQANDAADAQGNQVAAGNAGATGNAPAWFPGQQASGDLEGHNHNAVLQGFKSQELQASSAGRSSARLC